MSPYGQIKVALYTDTRFRGNVFSLHAMHQRDQLDIGPATLPPHWHGESMDMGMAIDGLLSRDGG